jgi:hypothetical protein
MALFDLDISTADLEPGAAVAGFFAVGNIGRVPPQPTAHTLHHHLRITARTDQGRMIYVDANSPVQGKNHKPMLTVKNDPYQKIMLSHLPELYQLWGASILSVWIWSDHTDLHPNFMELGLDPRRAHLIEELNPKAFEQTIQIRMMDFQREEMEFLPLIRHPQPALNMVPTVQLAMFRLDEGGIHRIRDGWNDRPVLAPGKKFNSIVIEGPDDAPFPAFHHQEINPDVTWQGDALSRGHFPGQLL